MRVKMIQEIVPRSSLEPRVGISTLCDQGEEGNNSDSKSSVDPESQDSNPSSEFKASSSEDPESSPSQQQTTVNYKRMAKVQIKADGKIQKVLN